MLNKWNEEVTKQKLKNPRIVKLNVGQPNYGCPEFVQEAINTVNQMKGNSYYVGVAGLSSVRGLVCDFSARISDLYYDPDEVIMTNGAKEAIYMALMATVNPGDEVIVITPYWSSYTDMIELLQGKAVIVGSPDFSLPLEEIEKAITPKTKVIIVNNPNNPSGIIYPEEDIKELADIAIEHNLFVVSDEVYNTIAYNGKPVSIAGFEGMRERTFVVNSFSKNIALPGYRIGFLCTCREIIPFMVRLKSSINGNINSFAQYVIQEVLGTNGVDEALSFISESSTDYGKRKDIFCDWLDDREIEYIKPMGAFYVFVKIPEPCALSSEEFARFLLEELEIAVAPGSYFGAEGWVRVSIAASEEEICEAIKRVGDFMDIRK